MGTVFRSNTSDEFQKGIRQSYRSGNSGLVGQEAAPFHFQNVVMYGWPGYTTKFFANLLVGRGDEILNPVVVNEPGDLELLFGDHPAHTTFVPHAIFSTSVGSVSQFGPGTSPVVI